ncbi:MAG TPA: aldo/keto reductase [Acidimicrobiales bacterium]|nr:aldo/keto reductase [Acidimicrobiales bacterium]
MLEHAEFGRTGHRSSRVIFGAAALARLSPSRADEVLPTLLEFGVNHLDTAADYGESELRLAPWMTEHRDRFFLATKTAERDGDGARASLERSLTRLGVDHVDLIQLHNLVEHDEWERAHAPGGAVAALSRAREEGLTRFVGVTGHGLRIAGMHRRSLERFEFDSVLLPYNYALLQNPGYRSEVEDLLQTCAERRVAVQTIKSVARRRWAPHHEGRRRHSWYEPLPAGEALGRAVRFALRNRQVFLNSSSDLRLLRPTLEAAAASGGPAGPPEPSDDQMERDMADLGIRPLFDGADLERI